MVVSGYQYRIHREYSKLVRWAYFNEKYDKCRGKLETCLQYEIVSITDGSCVPNLASMEVKVKLEKCRKKKGYKRRVCACACTYSFFFHWHYNPLWFLAFSVILFHSALSLHCFLHRLIPIICIFSSISTIHLFLVLPLILVPIGFHPNILLGVLLSSIRIT